MTSEELQNLLNAATPGPWAVTAEGISVGEGFEVFGACGCCNSPWMMAESAAQQNADARLIALAPTLARKVIAAEKLVEALQVARDNEDIEGMFFALAAWEAGE